MVGARGNAFWRQHFKAAGKEKCSVRHKLNEKTLKESFTIDEKQYSFDKGRLFAIDLTAKPVLITQLKADLRPLPDKGEPSRSELKSAMGKFRNDHKEVAQLFAD